MRLASFAVLSLFLIAVLVNYDEARSESDVETHLHSQATKRERLLYLLKRKFVDDVLETSMRSDDSDEDDQKNTQKDNDDENNNDDNNKYKSIGSGITIPLANGEKVNICEGKYVAIAAAVHDRIRDLLVSACSGASGKLNYDRDV